MSAGLHKPWIALCVVGVALGLACGSQDRRQPAAEDGAVATVAPSEPLHVDENRNIRLFGWGDGIHDIVFEGKAFTNILQHTSAGEGEDFDPDVDPTGKLLVFASTRHAQYSHLYIKPIRGATLTQITDEKANDTQPAFDPTGKRIAFVSDRAGHWDIWIVDTNGRNPIQITNTPAAELHPSWSPDGKRLVLCRINPRDNHGELWVVDLENPGVKQLIGDGLFPDWSPNGDKIAYQRSRARGSRWFSIWTLDIKDNEVLYPTEVASCRDVALIAPTWSPDGTQIAFAFVTPVSATGEISVTGGSRTDIGIVDTDGRGLRSLTSGHGKSYSPTWSVDGRVYFTTKLGERETIWSVKPFRPVIVDEPTIETGNRRAAAVFETDLDE